MLSKPPTMFGLSVRKSWMSRLLRGRSRSCCSSSPRAIAWLSRRDVVLPFGGHRHHVFEPADFQVQIGEDDSGRPKHEAGALHFLEAAAAWRSRCKCRDAGSGSRTALRIGLRFARHARRLVRNDDRRPGNDVLLRIEDGAANGPERCLAAAGHAAATIIRTIRRTVFVVDVIYRLPSDAAARTHSAIERL